MVSVGRGGGGPITGRLGMADQVGRVGGRGSWGRDRELEEEPTLLQDSEPAGEEGHETKVNWWFYLLCEHPKQQSCLALVWVPEGNNIFTFLPA